jgi:hypothetical protein
LVRLSSAATAITTSTGSTTSIASSPTCSGFTISSVICSIGIESSPAGLDPAWARIWFLDGVKMERAEDHNSFSEHNLTHSLPLKLAQPLPDVFTHIEIIDLFIIVG